MQLQTLYEARQLVNPLWHLTHLSGRYLLNKSTKRCQLPHKDFPKQRQHFIIKHYGFNELPEPARRSLLLRFTDQLTHFMALLLWVAGALAFVSGTPELGWAVWAVTQLPSAMLVKS